MIKKTTEKKVQAHGPDLVDPARLGLEKLRHMSLLA
jgi:hypothetical protein